MSWEAWFTLLVLGVMVAVLVRDLMAPSVAVVGAVVVLLVAGVVTPQQAFRGFSNPAPITVAALYVLARAVDKTGSLQPLVATTLGSGNGLRLSLLRLLTPAAAASAFLNNTPIVAMLVPQVTEWAHRVRRSPSYFLMPLSFAATVGGMITLIGSSTNLLVSGLLEAAGQPPIGMFEMTPVGFPIALLAVGLLIVLTPLALPERRPPRRDLEEGVREFVVGMRVVPGSPLDGSAVAEGQLRNLQGVYLVEIQRAGDVMTPVAPDTVLRGGDRLTFVGRADTVVDLQTTKGLTSLEQEHLAKFDTHRHRFFEAVVGAASPLVGKSLKEIGFRARYQAAVVAIHRAGQRVQAKLGSVRLRVGDTLLLLSDPGFRDRWRDRNAFLLISRLGATPPAVTRKAGWVAVIALGLVVTVGLGLLPVLHAALLAAFGLVVIGVLTPGEARSAVDLDVILVIAGGFGLAAALDTSGLAAWGGEILVAAVGALGPTGGLLGIALATVVLTNVISNNAAAVLLFPIASVAAAELGADPRAFAIMIVVTASASFLTPIAHQTNLMVYGPGGYRFWDYTRLGVVLTLLVIGVAAVLIPRVWSLG